MILCNKKCGEQLWYFRYKKETKKRTVLEPIPDSYNMDASTVKVGIS